MSDTRTLHRKLAQVMYEADRIPKNGTAPAAMGGFKFVQAGDAADVIRKALAEQKISMIPTSIELIDSAEHLTSSQKAMTTVTVRTTWTLTDGDSGESIVIQSMGAGADTGDKAIPKAQTNAMKYALLMGFLLSTGDDPEQTDTSDRRPQERNPRVGAPDHEAPIRADGGLIGTVEVGKPPADFELREGPDGMSLSFKLMDGRRGFAVVATGPLAVALYSIKDETVGKRVTAWGHMGTESFPKAGAPGGKVTYNVLTLERIQTPDYLLPSKESGGPSQAEVVGSGNVSPDPAAPSDEAELDALPLFQDAA